MADLRRLDQLLRAEDGDAGCTAGEEILDAYVELELAGEDPARVYPARLSTFRAAPAAAPITTDCSRRRAASPTSSRSSRPGTVDFRFAGAGSCLGMAMTPSLNATNRTVSRDTELTDRGPRRRAAVSSRSERCRWRAVRRGRGCSRRRPR
jgi:hypothetical protein